MWGRSAVCSFPRDAPTPRTRPCVGRVWARQPDRSCAAEPEISDRNLASSEHQFEQLLDQVIVPLACRLLLLAVPERHHVAFVWLDMVGDIGGSDTAGRLATQAQRVRSLGVSSFNGLNGLLPSLFSPSQWKSNS